MNALYSVTQIRAIEQAAQASLPCGTLMQRAGQAAARRALELVHAHPHPRILVLAGPGNNGGDALEAAYQLALAGVDVTVTLYADPSSQPQDARQALQRAQDSAVGFADHATITSVIAQQWELVIDGLFGIGLTRSLGGAIGDIVKLVNSLSCPILALDVPSGLDADTGALIGTQHLAIRASHTLTFIGDKPGLHTHHGRDYAGQVQVAALDLNPAFFPATQLHLNHPFLFSPALHRRAHNSHKGTYGDVLILGGAQGMQGAAILSGRAALNSGAGRVLLGFIDAAPAFDPVQPELMCRQASELDFSAGIVVAGPGAGLSRQACDLIVRVMNNPVPLVLDADALNLAAGAPDLQKILAQRTAATLLTPHPLEAARLLAISVKEVQADRLAAARQLAARLNAIVILKGAGTVIADSKGEAVINSTGNPALATAGSGDVLAGLCGALLAQKTAPWQAALAAVWLHGKAADQLVADGYGPAGLTAGELIPAIRTALNRITDERPAQ